MAESAGKLCGARRRFVFAPVAVALAIAFGASAALADELVEVTVTAQRRAEKIQDVPIAITAFTAESLQNKNVADLHALSNLTPNVNLDSGSPFSGDSSVLSASIRGIGQDDFAFNLDPGVGVYLDGVYLARTIGANQSLMDVDRIEILKGPQGTLFGRNTIGGAINIVTHTPGNEQKIQALVETGSFNRRDVAFTADLPISDRLLSSITLNSRVSDGYQHVIPYPAGSPFATTPFVVDQQTAYPKSDYQTASANGGINQQVVRGKLLWRASDSVDVTLSGDWSHQDQSAFPTTVLDITTPPATAAGVLSAGYGFMGALYNYCISTPAATLNSLDTTAGFGVFLFNTTNGLCGPRGNALGLAPGGAALGGAGAVGAPGGNILLSSQPRPFWNIANVSTGNKDTTYATGPSFAKYDMLGGSINIEWKLSDALRFKSITGARQIDWKVGVDLDGSPESMQEVTDHQYQHQLSQEFQLSGKAINDRLDWVGGLYYFQESGYVHDYVPFGGALYIYDVQNDVDTKAYAAYLHADFKITDSWGLTLGGRYSMDRKKFIGGQADLDAFSYKFTNCQNPAGSAINFTPPGAPAPLAVLNPALAGLLASLTCQQFLGFPDPTNPYRYFPPGQLSQNYNVFTPTAGLQWHVTSDMMAYASYSKGFKAGGWTTRLSNPIPDGSLAYFGPEYDTTYELGLKTEWLHRHLQANMAVFTSKYTGIQLQVQEAASPVTQNAGDARIKGAELELQAVFDGGFSFNLSGSYMNAYYTDILPNAASQGVTLNNELPKTPKYKYTVGPQYDIKLGSGATIRLGADYTRTASLFNDAPNTPLLQRPATDNVNAAIHWLSPTDKYEVVLGGTNLTDERVIVVGSVNGAEGETVGTYSRPREWYLSVKAKM